MKKNSTLIYFVNNFQPDQTASKQQFDKGDDYLFKAEDAEMAPSDETINNILGFARSYEVMETKKNGPVEMNLN